MPDIAASAGNVRATHPQNSERFDGLAAEAIAEGQLVAMVAATGKYVVADANVAGRNQPRGVALSAAGPGRPGFTFLKRGPVAGFTTNMPAYDAPVYASDTAGAIGTTTPAIGSVAALVGRVMAIPDGTPTKVIYFDFPWTGVYPTQA